MNILYIAYSCGTRSGSENAIGWNIPMHSALMGNNVYIITKNTSKPDLQDYLEKHPINNLKVLYVDEPNYPKRLRKLLFAFCLKRWQKRAYRAAKKLCAQEPVELIHQITPVELRNIGSYGKIQNVPFVVGPIGGGQKIAKPLRGYITGKGKIVERLRLLFNGVNKLTVRLTGKLKHCDYVFYANEETKAYLPTKGKSALCTEVGTAQVPGYTPPKKEKAQGCTFLIAGRLEYFKGHDFVFDAMEKLPKEADFSCIVVGAGPMRAWLEQRCRASEQLWKKVRFLGKVDYRQMGQVYEEADVLLMPSMRETTGTVILEAMAQGRPVIAQKAFGAKLLVGAQAGWLYDGKSREQMLRQLKGFLQHCIDCPEDVAQKGRTAAQEAHRHLWQEKLKTYTSVYELLCSKPD